MTFTLLRRFLVVAAVLALAATTASGYTWDGTCDYLGTYNNSGNFRQTTLADLAGQGAAGCKVGDTLFANFAYSFTPTASAPPATEVLFQSSQGTFPGPPASQSQGVGFDFNYQYGFTVAPNSGIVSLMIQYTAQWSGDASYDINEVDVGSLGGILTGTNGSATFKTLDCPGAAFGSSPMGTCSGGTGPSLFANDTYSYTAQGNPLSLSDLNGSNSNGPTFSKTTMVGLYDDIELNGGTNGTSGVPQAGINLVINYVDEVQSGVPEPATLLLVGFALLGLGGLHAGFRLKKARGALVRVRIFGVPTAT